MKTSTIIAPSILAADWGRFADEIQKVEAAGADWIHIDVMDGRFVPPITFGAQLVDAARKATKLPLDVHLMIVEPEKQIAAFADAGASAIHVHLEVCPHLHRVLEQIRHHGLQCGVAINPATPVSALKDVLDLMNVALLMTVNPGWGGQKFIQHSMNKVEETAKLIGSRQILISIDGGVGPENAAELRAKGAHVLVAGTSVFRQPDYTQAIQKLRN